MDDFRHSGVRLGGIGPLVPVTASKRLLGHSRRVAGLSGESVRREIGEFGGGCFVLLLPVWL